MSNKQLYDAALAAINRLYSDRTVSQVQARRNMEALQDEIIILLDSLKYIDSQKYVERKRHEKAD